VSTTRIAKPGDMCSTRRHRIFVKKNGYGTWVDALRASDETIVLVIQTAGPREPWQVLSDVGICYVWDSDITEVYGT
jgi:hypothetical protein